MSQRWSELERGSVGSYHVAETSGALGRLTAEFAKPSASVDLLLTDIHSWATEILPSVSDFTEVTSIANLPRKLSWVVYAQSLVAIFDHTDLYPATEPARNTDHQRFSFPDTLSEQERIEKLASIFGDLDAMLERKHFARIDNMLWGVKIDQVSDECSIGILRYLKPVRQHLRAWGLVRSRVEEHLKQHRGKSSVDAMLRGI